jgi:uncharacterized protein
MLLQKEVVEYLSRQIIDRVAPTMVELTNPPAAKDRVNSIILEELSIEDRLNDEVRDILQQYTDYMRREQVSYAEMFRKVKNQMIAERKIVRASGRDTGDGMKLSRDKVTDISHKLLAAMRRGREFRVKKAENDIRLLIVKIITEFLQAEDKIDKAARLKITSQKKEILEGGEEYNILFHRYYAEEMKKLGIDLPRA